MSVRKREAGPCRTAQVGHVPQRGGGSVPVRASCLAALLVLFGARNVAARAAGLGVVRQPLVYGQDDRRDVYEVDEAVLRDRARQSVVAFVSPQLLAYEADGTVRLVSPTLGETENVCPAERFADQPSPVFCSGFLLDQDLVATAGHCLGQKQEDLAPACSRLALVFGFLYEQRGHLASLAPDSVYRCRRVAAWSKTPNRADFAVIQLDRAVSVPLAPARLASRGAELGAPVTVIGFGAGLPAKVDGGGVISDVNGDWFGANTDTFAGSSGSPVFNENAEVLGLHVKGHPDWNAGLSCRQSVVAQQGTEWHQSIHPVVNALCASGWPSATLCGIEPACGDGYCSKDELPETCDVDCPVPRCGDGRCERDEPIVCDLDCPSFVPPPDGWSCPASYYGDRAGCDCDCGVRDVDCEDSSEVLNCPKDWSCDGTGNCAAPADPGAGDTKNAAAEPPVGLELTKGEGCGVTGAPGRRASVPPAIVVGLLVGWRLRSRSSAGRRRIKGRRAAPQRPLSRCQGGQE